MKKSMKKILIALVLLFVIIGLSVSVQAVTITETTNTTDLYDTIEDGTIIIGVTKFTPETIVTGVRAATAGADDLAVYMQANGNRDNYAYPNMYYYLFGDWYQYDIDGNLKYIDPISSLEIYFVDNEPKTGITFPSVPEEEVTYSVFFTSQEKEYDTQTVVEGAVAIKPTDPTRDGYTFTGWYLNGTLFDFTTEITADTVLVAGWQEVPVAPTYTVSFVNGTSVYDTITVEEGQTVSALTLPAREGWTFVGWYQNDTEFNFADKITSDTVLVAEWKNTTAVVTSQTELEAALADSEINLIKLGGSFEVTSSVVVSREIIIDGQNYTITKDGTPTYVSGGDNYIFKIYPAAADSEVVVRNIGLSNCMGAMIVGPNTIATVDSVDLTGNVWGGIEVSGDAELTATNITMTDEAYSKPVIWVNTPPIDTPTITFEGSTRIHYTENSKDEYHYYTQFNTVTFNSNGGTEVASETVVKGQKVTEPTDPTKEHYTFEHWYLDDEDTAFEFTTEIITSDITLNAKYEAIMYAITFDDSGYVINGAYGSTAEITTDNPQTYTVDDVQYVFAGWKATDGTIYNKGDKVTITGNETYTKTWTEQKLATTLSGLQTLLATETPDFDEIVVASPITIDSATPVTLDFSQTEVPVTVESTITVQEGGELTIQLGEKNVETEKTIVNNGTLKLEGTTGTIATAEDAGNSVHAIKNTKTGTVTINGGTYDATTHASSTVYNEGGEVIITDGTFLRSNENGSSATNSGGNSYYLIDNYGIMTIKGGEFVFDGYFSSLVHNGYYNYGTQYKNGNGSIKGIANPTLTIDGGTFSGGINTIKNDDGGILIINGGEFKTYSQQAVMNWNVTIINGGTFDGSDGDTCVWTGFGDATVDKGELTVNGGTFIAPANGYAIYQYGNATLTITDTVSTPVFLDSDGTSALDSGRISNKAFTDNRVSN